MQAAFAVYCGHMQRMMAMQKKTPSPLSQRAPIRTACFRHTAHAATPAWLAQWQPCCHVLFLSQMNPRVGFICYEGSATLLLGTGESRGHVTLCRHSDYVMAMAVAGPSSAPMLASAGLRAEVFLWDVVASKRLAQQVGRLLP